LQRARVLVVRATTDRPKAHDNASSSGHHPVVAKARRIEPGHGTTVVGIVSSSPSAGRSPPGPWLLTLALSPWRAVEHDAICTEPLRIMFVVRSHRTITRWYGAYPSGTAVRVEVGPGRRPVRGGPGIAKGRAIRKSAPDPVLMRIWKANEKKRLAPVRSALVGPLVERHAQMPGWLFSKKRLRVPLTNTTCRVTFVVPETSRGPRPRARGERARRSNETRPRAGVEGSKGVREAPACGAHEADRSRDRERVRPRHRASVARRRVAPHSLRGDHRRTPPIKPLHLLGRRVAPRRLRDRASRWNHRLPRRRARGGMTCSAGCEALRDHHPIPQSLPAPRGHELRPERQVITHLERSTNNTTAVRVPPDRPPGSSCPASTSSAVGGDRRGPGLLPPRATSTSHPRSTRPTER
jgi:hypothetical protein